MRKVPSGFTQHGLGLRICFHKRQEGEIIDFLATLEKDRCHEADYFHILYFQNKRCLGKKKTHCDTKCIGFVLVILGYLLLLSICDSSLREHFAYLGSM